MTLCADCVKIRFTISFISTIMQFNSSENAFSYTNDETQAINTIFVLYRYIIIFNNNDPLYITTS